MSTITATSTKPFHRPPLRLSRSFTTVDISLASSEPVFAKLALTPPRSPTAMSITPPSPGVSGASTTSTSAAPASSSYLPTGILSFLRRRSPDAQSKPSSPEQSMHHSLTFPSSFTEGRLDEEGYSEAGSAGMENSNIYTPPQRNGSPYQPPPLWPLTLKGWTESTPPGARLLSKGVAEEIRLLVPPRLQLVDEWGLVYSLEQDGVSLGTMYKRCEELRGKRNGYVLVVKDGDGELFGAYLSEAPHISPHYFGNGECFLWRASTFTSTTLSLPLPPSADTTHMGPSTTVRSHPSTPSLPQPPSSLNPSDPSKSPTSSLAPPTAPPTRTPSPSRRQRRFKAFPYSGINDYIMLCHADFFSIGGGDGNYGLWLDNTFERGISSRSLTFGNEPLSGEGEKFDVLGVELWAVGNLE